MFLPPVLVGTHGWFPFLGLRHTLWENFFFGITFIEAIKHVCQQWQWKITVETSHLPERVQNTSPPITAISVNHPADLSNHRPNMRLALYLKLATEQRFRGRLRRRHFFPTKNIRMREMHPDNTSAIYTSALSSLA